MIGGVARDRGSDGSTGGANTGRSSLNTGRNEFQRIREKSVGALVATAAVVAVNLSVALHNKIRSKRENGAGLPGRDRRTRPRRRAIGNQHTRRKEAEAAVEFAGD